MKLLTIVSVLTLASCASTSAPTPAAPKLNESQVAKNDEFFDCMVRLGADQSKGYEDCAKLL